MKNFKSTFFLLFLISFSFAAEDSLILPYIQKDNIKEVVGFKLSKEKNTKCKTKTIIKHIKDFIIEPVVYFDFNSYKLSVNQKKDLINMIKKLKNKNVLFILKGYADKPGNQEYNLELSKKRVETVKNFLIKNGIPEKKIITKYYGNHDLLINTPKPEKLNRRVLIQIVPDIKN